jgi:hypothetical protein
MTKHSRSKKATEIKLTEAKTFEVNLADILEKAVDSSSPPVYANHAQFGIGVNGNEIVIDFYRIEHKPGVSSQPSVSAIFLQRIIIPVGLGKGFVVGLANLIDGFERTTGITIPNQRKPNPDDTMGLWE